jgi:hypothetical protein
LKRGFSWPKWLQKSAAVQNKKAKTSFAQARSGLNIRIESGGAFF